MNADPKALTPVGKTSYSQAAMRLPTRYDQSELEALWQKRWEEAAIYRYDPNDRFKPTYSIDTPPPYPSGEFHMGNALNWCYFDFVARYKRMRGFNVHFPQGWDLSLIHI